MSQNIRERLEKDKKRFDTCLRRPIIAQRIPHSAELADRSLEMERMYILPGGNIGADWEGWVQQAEVEVGCLRRR